MMTKLTAFLAPLDVGSEGRSARPDPRCKMTRAPVPLPGTPASGGGKKTDAGRISCWRGYMMSASLHYTLGARVASRELGPLSGSVTGSGNSACF